MMKPTNRCIATCFVAALIVVQAAQAGAAPVRISFAGTVSYTLRDADGYFQAGEPMTGMFVYESSTPTSPPDWTGRYQPFQYPDHGFVTIAGYTTQFTNDGFVLVFDDQILNLPDPTLVDQLTALPSANGPILDGKLRPVRFGFNLWDTTASFFDGSELPTSLPPVSSFPPLPSGQTTANWFFVFADPNSEIFTGWVYGDLTAFEAAIIPEPLNCQMALLGAAIASPLVRLRRRK